MRDKERPTCCSSCLCFSTHSLHFSSPQVFPVPSVYSTVVGPQIASPLCVLSPSGLWELIYRALDLSARPELPPCQRILPFRNGGGAGKVMSECPQKSLEQFEGLFVLRVLEKRVSFFLNHYKKNATGCSGFIILIHHSPTASTPATSVLLYKSM